MCGYGTAFTKNPVKMLMDPTKLSCEDVDGSY